MQQSSGLPEKPIVRLAKTLESGNSFLPFTSPTGAKLPLKAELEERIGSFWDGVEPGEVPDELRRDIERILGQLYDDDEDDDLMPFSGAAEAVIVADGSRPVFFFEGDGLTVKGQPNGPFVDALNRNKILLENASRSVGRIETFDLPAPPGIDTYYDGTCFLVAPDLVMTNRHVVEAMIHDAYQTQPPFRLRNTYCVNFDGQLGGAGRRFRVEDVAWMAPHHIGRGGDFAELDMALLRLGGPFVGNPIRPDPLAMTSKRPQKDETAAIIGFPASAQIYSGSGVPPPGHELEEVLIRIFDRRFGYKRCASGLISGAAGSNPFDSRKWAVAYDLSTLAGNSGSPLIVLDSTEAQVSALHFYGEQRKANYGFVLDAMGQTLDQFGVSLH